MDVATNMAVHERAAPAGSRPQKRRSPKRKKVRKAAARKAASVTTSSQRQAKARGGKRRGAQSVRHVLPPAPPVAASPAIPPAASAGHPIPAVDSEVLLELCLQAEPALALVLPSRPEPLVETPKPEAEREGPVQAELALTRVGSFSAMPKLLLTAPKVVTPMQAGGPAAVTLPARPEPLVECKTLVAEPAAPLPTSALAALADAQTIPLPRSRALVPTRQQGLVDVIAFLLRDSGRRLARWSARRHKSRAERNLLGSAESRQRTLLSELEALDALRRNRG